MGDVGWCASCVEHVYATYAAIVYVCVYIHTTEIHRLFVRV